MITKKHCCNVPLKSRKKIVHNPDFTLSSTPTPKVIKIPALKYSKTYEQVLISTHLPILRYSKWLTKSSKSWKEGKRRSVSEFLICLFCEINERFIRNTVSNERKHHVSDNDVTHETLHPIIAEPFWIEIRTCLFDWRSKMNKYSRVVYKLLVISVPTKFQIRKLVEGWFNFNEK